MSQINTSVEILLKVRQQGIEQARQVEAAINALVGAQREGSAAGAAGAAAAQKEAGATAGLLLAVKGLAAGYLGLNVARRAASESRQAEQIEQRVLGVLSAQLKSRQQAVVEMERLKKLSKELFDELRIFDDDAILGGLGSGIAVAPQLLGREDRFARASADLAVALFDGDFNFAAETLAKTLEGVPGALQKSIPELRQIAEDLGSPERFERFLREGGALALVEDRFGGAAAAFADSRLGAEAEAAARFNDALETVGDSIRTGILPFLDGLSFILKRIEAFANQDADDDQLGAVLRRIQALPAGDQIAAIRTEREALLLERDVLQQRLEALKLERAPQPDQVAANRFGDKNDRLASNINAGVRADDQVRGVEEAISDLDRLIQALDNRVPEIERLLGNEQGFALAPFILKPDQRTALLGDLGVIDELTARISQLKVDFGQLDPTFDPPPGFVVGADEADTETEFLYNLAVARETAIRLTAELAKRQDDLNKAIKRANDLAEAGEISNAKRFEIIQTEAQRLRDFLKDLGLNEQDISEFAAQQVAAIEALSGIELPETPEFIKEFREQIRGAQEDIEDLASTVTNLSDELRTRLEDPFAGLIDKAAQGEASVLDFADTFIATFRRLIAEQLSEQLLDGLFGGRGASAGGGLFGGVFDLFGGLLGFDEGGVVPGPDLGRDSRVIAVRGNEYVVRPEAVARPGILDTLDAINAGRWRPDAGRFTALPESAAGFHARASRSASYATGGLVDVTERFAAAGRQGGSDGGLRALPVLVADRELAEQLHSGRNAIAASDAMAREPARYRAAIGDDGRDGLGRRV